MKKGLRSRRVSVLARLEAQLKSGVKPSKELDGTNTPLTDSDKKRILKEIQVLNEKINKEY